MIKKRSNGYGVRIYRDKKQVWVGTFPTLKQARAAERDALAKAQPAQVRTVTEFAEWWQQNKTSRNKQPLRGSTKRHYAEMLRPFVADFGSRRMSDITPMEAHMWANAHKGNFPVVRNMFNDARRLGVAVSNPFASLGIEKSQGRRHISALTLDELHQLADLSITQFGSYGPTFRALVLFAGYVGLRPGELFRLTWADIDFKAQTVHIQRSLSSTGEVTLPKNGKDRHVVLPPPAGAALRSMPRRADSPCVFTTSTGQPFSKTSFDYYWRQLRAAAGRQNMDFYELRHFCATELLRRNLRAADVAVQLGHTDGGTLVRELYGHPEEDDARARVLAAFTDEKPKLRAV